MEVKLEIPRWGPVSGFLSYTNMHGIGDLPLTGGLLLGDEAAGVLGSTSRFPISQDQRNTVQSRFRYQATSRVWLAAGGSILLPRRLPAAEFNLRSFHNQPADSPLHKRLIEMWSAVATETHGRVHVETFADNNQTPGGDPAVLKMLVDGRLEFFNLNGGLIGTVVPAVNVQGIPFVFRTQTQVYRALDGDLGDYLGQEMRAKGIYAVPQGCFENGFRQISCSARPIRNAADL